MPLFTANERKFVQDVANLAHCNPFTAERIECERAALGDEFNAHLADWNTRPGGERDHPNLEKVLQRAEQVLERARAQIAKRPAALEADRALYEDLLLTVLYHRHRSGLDELILDPNVRGSRPAKLYRALAADAACYLDFGDRRIEPSEPLPHLFAGFFQIRRAFENIFRWILGVSQPAIELRAAVWQSIFTHDMRRYRRVLYARMGDFTTLVTGPSGTGKELVAEAIGRSRYIPFDAATGRFDEDFSGSFYAVNLAALSPTLIESELFGHKRGSFTGAVADREGWLETCPKLGTVFLDEIGEIDASIQIKLLRVLQSREFCRLGETRSRAFRGKIIAATNRDLAAAMQQGHFRQDFYYRLCADMVEVPSLRERLADNRGELSHLVAQLAARIVGDEAPPLADEVVGWIENNIVADYPWPGNVRELEQCVRNVLIRRAYVPPTARAAASRDSAEQELAEAIAGGRLTADELLRRYCTMVYAATGSYEATGRKLGLDRRTVRTKVDSEVAQKLSGNDLGG